MRASSCAAAIASCALIVSLLKSIWSSLGGRLRPVEHELPAVLLVDALDLLAEAALELAQLGAHPGELVLELEHALDAGEVQAPLGGQPLDLAQPLEVALRVEARVPGGAARADEALRLVDAQRLRVHADELGGDEIM